MRKPRFDYIVEDLDYGSRLFIRRYVNRKHKVVQLEVPFFMNGYDEEDWYNGLTDAERYFFNKCKKVEKRVIRRFNKIMDKSKELDHIIKQLRTAMKRTNELGIEE